MPEVAKKTENDFPGIHDLNTKNHIIVKGAKVNNLNNLSVAIPRNRLVVITGLSGSGKTSLAFDTLFAEGQRMYVESLSAYARQFLGRMEKPDVEYIKGLSPAIAIEQKVNSRTSRSTVGTTTEIYDYLKLLFSRIGQTYSPVSDQPVKKDNVDDVLQWIFKHDEGTKLFIHTPLEIKEGRSLPDALKILLQQGFTRVLAQGKSHFIEDLLQDENCKNIEAPEILIDRAVVKKDEDETYYRLSDSIQTAFFEGHGICNITIHQGTTKTFSDKFEADGIVFEEPTLNFFSFNNPFGACRTCEGFGNILGIDPDKVIPNQELSVYEGAIAPWGKTRMADWYYTLINNASKFGFPIHKPFKDLTEEQKQLLWKGNKYFKGLNDFFRFLESKTYKIQYRVMLSRYRGRTKCPDCEGTRLRKDTRYVKIDGYSLPDLVLMQINQVKDYFDNIHLSETDWQIGQRIITEIKNRLQFLLQVGLEYLTLNRLTNSLSGGEHQRIKLATSLGSALVGSMYILDEPSIGLHPRDTANLVKVLKYLRDLGNTVIVVEHEEEVIRAADEIVDIGPAAGSNGGRLMFQMPYHKLMNGQVPDNAADSYTYQYLKGLDQVTPPATRRKWNKAIEIKGARENNLKSIDVKLPLNIITVVTGVSGSGKSTLVQKILHPALTKIIGDIHEEVTGSYDSISGAINSVRKVEYVDQNPIGKSSRSNPVTYIKAYDYIRTLFAEQHLSKQRGYKPAFFSFNVDGGRCEACQGEGVIKIEMQFMADIYLTCESCNGKRFKKEILEVTYKEKNIADILNMTIDDSITFFEGNKKLVEKLKPLQEVGLGYLKLGQSANSLSGGEAQRVKLASYLDKGRTEKNNQILFIFDEPTTGLHFHDIKKLYKAINALVELGNTVVIIEHNMEVIKCADWIIDLGPEGGDKGGYLCFEGSPEELIQKHENHTARFLKEKL